MQALGLSWAPLLLLPLLPQPPPPLLALELKSLKLQIGKWRAAREASKLLAQT